MSSVTGGPTSRLQTSEQAGQLHSKQRSSMFPTQTELLCPLLSVPHSHCLPFYLISSWDNLQRAKEAWVGFKRDSSAVLITGCSCRTGSFPRSTSAGPQLPVTPIQEGSDTPFWPLHAPQILSHTYTSIKTFLKKETLVIEGGVECVQAWGPQLGEWGLNGRLSS